MTLLASELESFFVFGQSTAVVFASSMSCWLCFLALALCLVFSVDVRPVRRTFSGLLPQWQHLRQCLQCHPPLVRAIVRPYSFACRWVFSMGTQPAQLWGYPLSLLVTVPSEPKLNQK